MSKRTSKSSWLIPTTLIFWGLVLVGLAFPSFGYVNGLLFKVLPVLFLSALVLTLFSSINIARGAGLGNPKVENNKYKNIVKIISVMLLIAIIVGTTSAIKSFWYHPMDDNYGDRFLYENIATGAGYLSLLMIYFISAFQKDIYYVIRNRLNKLDERQLQHRREVFELSYKIAIIVVGLFLWFLMRVLFKVPEIIANNYGSIPNHVFWVGANLVMAMFALPLVIGAWKKK